MSNLMVSLIAPLNLFLNDKVIITVKQPADSGNCQMWKVTLANIVEKANDSREKHEVLMGND